MSKIQKRIGKKVHIFLTYQAWKHINKRPQTNYQFFYDFFVTSSACFRKWRFGDFFICLFLYILKPNRRWSVEFLFEIYQCSCLHIPRLYHIPLDFTSRQRMLWISKKACKNWFFIVTL